MAWGDIPPRVRPREPPAQQVSADLVCGVRDRGGTLLDRPQGRREPQALANRKITILGTDISAAAIEAAKAGSYDDRAVHLVPSAEKKQAFDLDPIKKRWVLKPEVRALVAWKLANLLNPIEVEPFDCIFIKNVLIYFDAESKRVAVRHLLSSLVKGGYLVVGPTEGIFGMLGSLTKHKTWLYQNPT